MSPSVDRRPLVERMRPALPEEMVGQNAGVAELSRWADSWSDPKRPPRLRAALLEGPPGVGKTTAALAVARRRGWTVIEMNASDARNETAIQEIAGRASISMTLGDTGAFRRPDSGGRALILLDEADCLSGRRTEEGTAAKPAPISFREFLRTRYGSLGALARAWKLGEPGRAKPFEEWSDLPMSGGRAAWTRTPEVQRDLEDWRGAARPKDRSDRGGLGAIAELVRTTRQPVVLTVNDASPLLRYSPTFGRSVARIRFGPIAPADLRTVLARVAGRERYAVAPEALEAIVRRARGDVRAALNDLEAIAPLPAGPAQLGPLAARDRIGEFAELTEEVLSRGRLFRSVEIRERVDAPPDEIFPWIEENLPRFAPSPAAIARGFEPLARSEQFLARARRQRVWSLWSFASELMTGGVGVAIAEAGGPGATRAFFPTILAEMGRSRVPRAIRDAVAQKTGARLHASRRKSREEFLPFLERWIAPRGHGAAMASAPGRRARLAEELGLTRTELAYLAGIDEATLENEIETSPTAPEEPSPEPTPPAPAETAAPPKGRQRRLGDFAG